MLTRPNFGMNVTDNPLTKSPYFVDVATGAGGSPPAGDNFLLLDGTNFLLLDGTNLELLS